MEKYLFDLLERKADDMLAMIATIDFLIEEKNLESAKKIWEKILDFGKDKDFLDYILQDYNKHIINEVERIRRKIINLEEENNGINAITSSLQILKKD